MTENKRFNIHLSEDKETFWISDVGTHKEIEIQHYQGAVNVVNLLNAFHEENTMLKEEIKDFQDLLASKEETLCKPIIQENRLLKDRLQEYEEQIKR